MGLNILTSFSTAEGFEIQSIYCRIVMFTYNLINKSVSVQYNFYINRDKRLQGYSSISFPKASQSYTFTSQAVPTMSELYAFLKITLEELEFAVEDVLEEGQGES